MKLGIIGTNWITKQFVEAAEATGEFTLTSVYSRKVATAQKFGADFKNVTEYFDNLNEFFEQGTFEVVYIASPNSLHFEQTLQALKAKKHVIVEKPMCSNPAELKVLQKYLHHHQIGRAHV